MSMNPAPSSVQPAEKKLGFVLQLNLTIGLMQIKDASKRLKHRLLTRITLRGNVRR